MSCIDAVWVQQYSFGAVSWGVVAAGIGTVVVECAVTAGFCLCKVLRLTQMYRTRCLYNALLTCDATGVG